MSSESSWTRPLEIPHLATDDVHIWRIPLNEHDATTAARVLSKEEQTRCARMLAIPRIRFSCTRAAMRNILAGYLNLQPDTLVFASGKHGKLFLPDHRLYFNVSHAGDIAVFAACRHAEIGVDIEKVDSARALREISARFFSDAEQRALATCAGSDYTRGFFRCWSRKEAVIKALGEGLACPLGLFDVSLEEKTAALLDFRRSDVDVSRWSMAHLDVDPDYEAAVAVIGSIGRLHRFDYHPGTGYFH